MTGDTDHPPRNKVATLIDEYSMDGLGSELEGRWTADGAKRMSLRDLADYFNRRLLKTAIREAGEIAPEREVTSMYQNLIDDDISPGVRTDTQQTLREYGVDVALLEQNFVTYQAIRSYLKDWRGAEYEQPSNDEKRTKDRESIQRLLTKTLSVTEDRLEKLRETDRIDAEEFEVFIDAKVLCQECGIQYAVADFIDNRGCDCLQDSE